MIFPNDIDEVIKEELKKNDIAFYDADIPGAVEIAKECEKKGVDVIISRAGLEAAIKKCVSVPVVNCEVTHSDIISSILKIKKEIGPELKEMGLFNYASVTYDVKYIEEITHVKIHQFWYWDDPEDLRKRLIECKKAGIEIALGANMTMKFSKELGMKGFMKHIGRETLEQAIQKAHEIIEIRLRDLEYAEKIKSILSFAREGILFVNEENKIDYANPRASEILCAQASLLEGKQVSQIILDWLNNKDGVFLDQIAKTPSNQIIYNRVPVKVKGANYGSVVTFSETSQIQEVEEKIRTFLHDKGFVSRFKLEDIIGNSPEIREVKQQAEQFAKTNFTVLITGETGTGKELFAHGIHRDSPRVKHPFVTINCAALPDNLLESELFGYEEGAFTGARKGGKPGYFELAHRGTIFLDEIGELKLPLQGKLLRVIQSKEVMRIGGERIIPIDTRIVAATNSDLLDLVAKKEFRSDLYYWLNVLNLHIPPLRLRKDDAMILAKHFIDRFKRENGLNQINVSDALLESLYNYGWPGNVRELECLINRFCILSSTSSYPEVREIIPSTNEQKIVDQSEKQHENVLQINIGRLDKMTDEIFWQIYKIAGENKAQTAKILGINRMTVYKWLEKRKNAI